MTSPDSPASRDRGAQRLHWTRTALADPSATLERASVDAGHRSYWRTTGSGTPRIVMDAPPGLEDVRPWLRIRDLLETGGVRVPHVLARDIEAGFLLLEDLGPRTLAQTITAASADADFDAALSQLLKLQAIVPPAAMLPPK